MRNFFSKAPVAPAVRPMFNIGCLMDIPTGTYHIGNRGESVLVGGYGHIHSVTGAGNMFKTDLILWPMFRVLDRYASARGIVYDTENSLKYMRFNRIAAAMANLRHINFEKEAYSDDPKLVFIQKADVRGDVFFEHVKTMRDEKLAAAKEIRRTMPVRLGNGELIRTGVPHILIIDSLSAFSVSAVEDKIIEKNNVGDSGGNTMFLKDGAAKTQLIMQLPNLTVNADIHIGMTAHIGNRVEMDPYAPKPIALTFSKNGTKAKGAPEKFQFINDLLLEVYNSKPLTDPKTKEPKYPKIEADREQSNDLFLITSVNSRNKGGPSGVTFPFIVSQTEGLHVGLTEYNYLKETGNKFGIGGNDRTYYLELVPEVKLQRTTLRGKIDEDARLQRALEIQSEMLQMRNIWRKEDDLYCRPEELFRDLAEMGYDWDQLLDTRGYWMYHEDEADQKPFLSTMDLLRMRKGLYHPYWLKDDKKTVIEKHWEIGDWK